MHEIKIAEDLSSIVLDTAISNGLKIVSRVYISFGEMVQIVPDIFETAFREAVRNTIAENAELEIKLIRVKIKCRKCENESHIEENLFVCKNCGSSELVIIQGKELFVESIEGE